LIIVSTSPLWTPRMVKLWLSTATTLYLSAKMATLASLIKP